MAILVAIIVAWLCCWMYAPTRRFAHGFASLVENPETRQNILMFALGRSTIAGRFQDRPVMLQLVQPRDHRVGYIVLSMKTDAVPGAPWKDSLLTSENRDIDRATFDLEGRYGLILVLDAGWFSGTFTGSGMRFPGRFDPDRWRKTLEQMHVIVEWMEKQVRR